MTVAELPTERAALDIHRRPAGQRAGWPGLMTVERAGHELSVSRVTIYELLKSGALKSVKIGASRRIVSASVEKLIIHGAPRKAPRPAAQEA